MLSAYIIAAIVGSYHHAYEGSASDLSFGFGLDFDFDLASSFGQGFVTAVTKYLVLKRTYLGVRSAVVMAVVEATIQLAAPKLGAASNLSTKGTNHSMDNKYFDY